METAELLAEARALKEMGDLEGAKAASRRADEQGDPTGPFNLVVDFDIYVFAAQEADTRRTRKLSRPWLPALIGLAGLLAAGVMLAGCSNSSKKSSEQATGSLAHHTATHRVTNGLIAFDRSSSYDTQGRAHSEVIMLMRSDGSHIRRVTSGFDPVFLPTRPLLALFHRFTLMTIGLTQRHRQTLIRTSDVIGRPSFSPDGSTLVAFDYTQQFLFTLALRDRHVHVLPTSSDLTAPSYSPSGREIIANKGSLAITMQSDGRHRRIIPHSVGDFEPVFSPNGRWILFARIVNHPGPQPPFARYGLFAMRSNGTHRHRLGRFTTVSDPPDATYSPDGRFIVFMLRHSPIGRDNIAMILADGSGLRQLTHGGSKADNRDPGWQPIAATSAALVGRQ